MKNRIAITLLALLNIGYSHAQVNSANGQFSATGGNNMQLRTNTTTRITVLSASGNVGIGTTTPADLFHVAGNIRGNQFNAINGIYNTIGATNLSFNTNGTNRLTVLNTSGFVGIGTTSPTQPLHVIGNILTDGIGNTSGTFRATGTSNFILQTNTSDRLTILNTNGFVGIGKTNPTFALDVNGAINANAINVNGVPFAPTSSQWNTSGATINYLAGNVGIGIAAPTEALHVNGNVLSDQFTASTGNYNSTGNLSFQTAGTAKLSILNTNGNVGIGTVTPESKLHVIGNMVLDNGSAPTIYTGTGSTELNRYLLVANAVGASSPSGLKAGGVLIADSYTYANPSKNDLVVKGKVSIGTPLVNNPNNYTLAVNGKIGAKDMQVETSSTTWPDYVFSSTYPLPSLYEVERYIQQNQHLKDVPSAQEIEQKHSLGEMDAILLKKVEELILYIIEQQKQIDELKKELKKK